MNKNIKILKKIIVFFGTSFLLVLFYPRELYEKFGSISWYLLIFVMYIRPLRDIFPKCKVFSFLLKFRREFGVLVGIFALTHALGYLLIARFDSVFGFFTDSFTWDYTRYLFWGLLALIISLPLLITSNSITTKILGKHWKTLQRLSYLMFMLVAIHIYMIRGEILPVLFVVAWIILYFIAFLKDKNKPKNTSNGPKWLCVPCGYIYDENIGDPDSGIVPGTKFEDIPSDWVCPVCGVGKDDFILLDSSVKLNDGKVSTVNYLTDDVIELTLESEKDIIFENGQFVSFSLNDEKGKFNRSYSIASKSGNSLVFLIKLKENGRAGDLFKKIKIGDTINFSNVSGRFLLKNTKNKKIFIATGTGLAPIYAMITSLGEDIEKELYFGVSYKKDLFYLDKLKEIKNLTINIYISREEIDGFNFGRINFENIKFDLDSEIYICGNPGVLSGAVDFFQTKNNLKNVFYEKF